MESSPFFLVYPIYILISYYQVRLLTLLGYIVYIYNTPFQSMQLPLTKGFSLRLWPTRQGQIWWPRSLTNASMCNSGKDSWCSQMPSGHWASGHPNFGPPTGPYPDQCDHKKPQQPGILRFWAWCLNSLNWQALGLNRTCRNQLPETSNETWEISDYS